nr:ABC transporter I family member 10-like [Tanacetum cinerariifolium]
MFGLTRLLHTPSACLCLQAYFSIGPGADGLDPTGKQMSLMLSEPPLFSVTGTRRAKRSLEPTSSLKVGVRNKGFVGALVEECKVLLLDELTTFLDENDHIGYKTKVEIEKWLGVIKAVKNTLSISEDVTALRVTHRLEELEYADGAVYMEDGRVLIHGAASTIMDSIEARKASYTNSINYRKPFLQQYKIFSFNANNLCQNSFLDVCTFPKLNDKLNLSMIIMC